MRDATTALTTGSSATRRSSSTRVVAVTVSTRRAVSPGAGRTNVTRATLPPGRARTQSRHRPRSGHRDRRRARPGAHLLGHAQRLLDERLDDLRLRDGLDDLAAHEDLALAVARRHAEIGLAR